ncbi:hypothetical protein DFP72DRAFT_881933 [Ephemerocybe angulata]|uniref:Uncharacterized protein n=1 Tax=Ephemerocybe angulata TaxID=980116 RepID=A0A8H6I8Q5_9AGAR|nr:hypothetical protein DFP72DRAFT_881933 [Tulosesus angulatus]
MDSLLAKRPITPKVTVVTEIVWPVNPDVLCNYPRPIVTTSNSTLYVGDCRVRSHPSHDVLLDFRPAEFNPQRKRFCPRLKVVVLLNGTSVCRDSVLQECAEGWLERNVHSLPCIQHIVTAEATFSDTVVGTCRSQHKASYSKEKGDERAECEPHEGSA